MVIVVRRNKPLFVVKRTRTHGKGWIDYVGLPPQPAQTGEHVLEKDDQRLVFLWRADKQMWQGGEMLYSPDSVRRYNYLGPCTIVYRKWIPLQIPSPRMRRR